MRVAWSVLAVSPALDLRSLLLSWVSTLAARRHPWRAVVFCRAAACLLTQCCLAWHCLASAAGWTSVLALCGPAGLAVVLHSRLPGSARGANPCWWFGQAVVCSLARLLSQPGQPRLSRGGYALSLGIGGLPALCLSPGTPRTGSAPCLHACSACLVGPARPAACWQRLSSWLCADE